MHLLKNFIRYFIVDYAFISFQSQDKTKIWIQIKYSKFHLEFQLACGGIEPQFYKNSTQYNTSCLQKHTPTQTP
jgi:hypothetical protein